MVEVVFYALGIIVVLTVFEVIGFFGFCLFSQGKGQNE
jgi:hypothetical protein